MQISYTCIFSIACDLLVNNKNQFSANCSEKNNNEKAEVMTETLKNSWSLHKFCKLDVAIFKASDDIGQ